MNVLNVATLQIAMWLVGIILNRGLRAVGLTVNACGAKPVGVARKQEILKVI